MPTVEDVMTRDVISVSPETPIHRAARLMAQHGVSGLPVVDHGRLVGIISDGDLISRHARRTRRPWWKTFFEDAGTLAEEYRKAILTNRNFRRLPVVRDGQLVGIVSRGDLVRALGCGCSVDTPAPSAPA